MGSDLKNSEKCYLCDSPATTVEHVPARVIFPALKDLQAEMASAPDLRVGLITVPACEKHNNKLSKDDEYAAVAIAMHMKKNSVAVAHWHTKIKRALMRSKTLGPLFTRGAKHVVVAGEPLVMIALDRSRLESVMIRNGKGLVHYELGTNAGVEFTCYLPDLIWPDGSKGPDSDVAAVCTALDAVEWRGNNPLAFKYQMVQLPGLIFRLRFYEAFDAILVQVLLQA